MRKIFLFLVLAVPVLSNARVDAPTNVYFTVNEIRGNADPYTTVKIDRNTGAVTGLPIISVAVNMNGYFAYVFDTPLPLVAGSPATQPVVKVWAVDTVGAASSTTNYTALTAADALQRIINGTQVLPTNKPAPAPVKNADNPEIDGVQATSTTFRYKVTMLNTNFTIPLARFNFVKDNTKAKKGEILLFNSIGAGVGISFGEIERTTDATGANINTDYTNTFGIHLGVLFSSGKDGNEQKNIFAPTLALSVLDFQLGGGYELGTTLDTQKKGFVTLAYAIPLSKLIKGKYYIFRASQGFNSANPLPKTTGSSVSKSNKGRFI